MRCQKPLDEASTEVLKSGLTYLQAHTPFLSLFLSAWNVNFYFFIFYYLFLQLLSGIQEATLSVESTTMDRITEWERRLVNIDDVTEQLYSLDLFYMGKKKISYLCKLIILVFYFA